MPSLTQEISRIAQFLAPLAKGESGAFNLTNDAAALEIPAGKKLIVTTDSCIEGVHLPKGCSLAQLARKGMRRNLSDLAAMGATPWRYTLNLHTTRGTADAEIAAMAAVLDEEQAQFGCVLIGGDCTEDDARAHLAFTMFGLCDNVGHSRSGARAGDDIYVTGVIGNGLLGLREVHDSQFTIHDSPTTHYYAPMPRLEIGAALQGIASSCIDISDGLLQDAMRIEQASNVRLMIEKSAVPLSPEAHAALQQNTITLQQLLTGGDDYELLFTAPQYAAETLQHIAVQHGVSITKIGLVE